MSGTDTIRGIGYQQAMAVHVALDIAESNDQVSLRVEGMVDIVDIEILDSRNRRISAQQVKTRSGSLWTPKPVIQILRRWLDDSGGTAEFTFVTDCELGPGAAAVSEALDAARAGNPKRLALLMSADEGAVKKLERARIRVQPGSVGAILTAAEGRVRVSIDPLSRTVDALSEAQNRVNALFTMLTERAGRANADERIVSASEIRRVIGGLEGVVRETIWPGEIANAYVEAVAAASDDTVDVGLRRLDFLGANDPVDSLLDGTLGTLSGATGSGKTSLIELLRSRAATQGRVVASGRAETYLPGRLDVFAAEALGAVIGKALPPSTGRQFLADASVVLVIDGASEIPDSMAAALADDLGDFAAAAARAHVIVVGRENASLRRLLSKCGSSVAFATQPPDRAQRELIVKKSLGAIGSAANSGDILAQAERDLGDGANNPFMLSRFAQLTGTIDVRLSRAALYGLLVDSLGARAGVAHFGSITFALALVFANLLSQQRRYADAYEWTQLTENVASDHPELGLSGSAVRAGAIDSGLVNKLGIGETIAAFHDSIADYLASLAHSQGIANRPTRLTVSDEEWLRFASENTPALASEFGDIIVRDIPFAAVKVSVFDEPGGSIEDIADRATHFLRALCGDSSLTVEITETRDGRRLASAGAGSPQVVGDHSAGPLQFAVRLWRLHLKRRLQIRLSSETPRPLTAHQAAESVRRVLIERRRTMNDLLSQFPVAQSRTLIAAIGVMGAKAEIGSEPSETAPLDWELIYWPSTVVEVVVTLTPRRPDVAGARTLVTYFCASSGLQQACVRVVEEIENVASCKGWLI